MAQSAAAAISKGCQFLSEGRAEIDKFKKNTEKAIGDAKAIYKEVTGLWGWITGLFNPRDKKTDVGAPKAEAVQTQVSKPSKKLRKEPEPELTYEEFQARQVHEICEHLKVYFEAIRQLKAHCRELEQQSLTTEKVADSAIDRIEMEWQMAQLQNQVSHAMIYETPEKLGLGDLYKKFLRTYDEILEEQEFDRQVKLKKARDEASQREHRKKILVYKGMYLVAILFGILEAAGLYFTL
jgi:hypothetical protein